MSETVLHYWDLYGRAEVTRMILHFTNTPFRNQTYTREEWFANHKYSGEFEFEMIPMLEYEGRKYSESHSIERFLCMKYNFYPTDPYEVYLVESIGDFREDLTKLMIRYKFHLKDEAGYQKWLQEDLPKALQKIEKRLEANNGGNGFFVGDRVTMADFVMFEFAYDMFLRPGVRDHRLEVIETHAPKLKAFSERFIELSEGLKNYLATRPERAH